MSFETAITVEEAMNNIESSKYLLPSIQREFIWDEEQICKLFDSLLRGYPIGAFLFWEIGEELRNKLTFYKFIKDYHERDGIHNEKVIDNKNNYDILNVLDGQQRLTSLYIGLYGSYTVRRNRSANLKYDKSFVEKYLCLNLTGESEEIDSMYEFKFLSNEEIDNEKAKKVNYWFKVSNILTLKQAIDLNDYINENISGEVWGEERRRRASGYLFNLREYIFTKEVINYYLEKEQSLAKVLDVFIRINAGGTKLEYSDLLLSVAAANWKKKDAREEIIKLLDEINDIGDGFGFSKDFVLQTAMVLCEFDDIQFKLQNFTFDNMERIEDTWDDIYSATVTGVKLLSSFGFYKKNLTSNFIIIPIIYYIFKKGIDDTFIDSYKSKDKDDRKNIKKFVLKSTLKKIAGGVNAHRFLNPLRKIIKDRITNERFPYEEIMKTRIGDKTFIFHNEDIEELLESKYNSAITFSVLSVLYPSYDYKNIFQVDHIYPKSKLSGKKELRKAGIDESLIQEYIENKDKLPNLQLINNKVNEEKSNTHFEEWVNKSFQNERDLLSYKTLNFIPDINDYHISNFSNFYNARRELLLNKLKIILQE